MRDATLEAAASADVVVMAAAVADFRPVGAGTEKLKKEAGPPALVLEPTPDILAELGVRRTGALLVGFAAETSNVEAEGRRKLEAKGVDLLVANVVGREGTGFGTDTNDAAILAADGDDVALRTWSKSELATVIVDRIVARLDSTAP
jgi:phosphopantothenoylcysteine decarboxylase/phosphopantothenate--cysteine ligase